MLLLSLFILTGEVDNWLTLTGDCESGSAGHHSVTPAVPTGLTTTTSYYTYLLSGSMLLAVKPPPPPPPPNTSYY